MRYVSTRGGAPILSFEDAMLAGLARDGGLYVPETWPALSLDDIRSFRGRPYTEVALDIISRFTGDTFHSSQLQELIEAAYAPFGHRAITPLVQIGDNDWLLELFHGPTLAFKDVAMQVIGQMFDDVLTRRKQHVTIVGATSGDTGSAAIEAFRGRQAADVFILYPHGRVSEVQRRQMTTPVEANVHALAVEGDFDDCQALVKAMFNDFAFRDALFLAAVNSINWTRVLAQVVYYFTAAAAVGGPDRPVSFSVPTGNFGDIFAGFVAKRMGLPIERLVIATNENDILHRTLNSGDYSRGAVRPTVTPSMDIQVSSNFERLMFELYGRDGAAVKEQMEQFQTTHALSLDQGQRGAMKAEFDSASISEVDTLDTMRMIREVTGHVIDPHTAVGVAAAERIRGKASTPMITLATAHPAKFPDAVNKAMRVHPALPERMADLFRRPERVTVLPNDLQAVETHIAAHSRMAEAL